MWSPGKGILSLARSCHIKIPKEKTSLFADGSTLSSSSGAMKPGVPTGIDLFRVLAADVRFSFSILYKSFEQPKSANLQTPLEEIWIETSLRLISILQGVMSTPKKAMPWRVVTKFHLSRTSFRCSLDDLALTFNYIVWKASRTFVSPSEFERIT